MLSFRQREILLALLSKHAPVAIRGLAEQYRLSSKSILNDLKAVGQWLDEHGAALHIEDGAAGPVVSEQQRSVLRSEVNHMGANGSFLNKNERVQYILDRLFLSREPVTNGRLCEELMVSKPTIVSDLESAGEELERRHFTLERKKGKGYWISGEERQLRVAMEERLGSLLWEKHVYSVDRLFRLAAEGSDAPREVLSRFLAGMEPYPVREILGFFREEEKADLAEEDAISLAVTILVVIHRLLMGKRMDAPVLSEENVERERAMLALADRAVSAIGRCCQVPYNQYEREYIVYRIYECEIWLRRPAGEAETGLEETVEQMTALLPPLGEEAGALLRRELRDYLSFVLHRRHLGIRSNRALYVRVKSAYPRLNTVAERLSAVFQEREGFALDQDEIGMLTLLLAAYGTFTPVGERALVVCDRGETIAAVLSRRIRNNIHGLTVEKTVSLRELTEQPALYAGVDLVISTVELPDCPVPVFVVDPVMDYDELQRIRDYVSGVKAPATGAEGRVTVSDLAAHKERYSRRLATILSLLSEPIRRVEALTGQPVKGDNIVGLAIHLSLSLVLWENEGIYPGGAVGEMDQEDPRLVDVVDDFLDRISTVVGIQLPRSEGIPILQYLKNGL